MSTKQRAVPYNLEGRHIGFIIEECDTRRPRVRYKAFCDGVQVVVAKTRDAAQCALVDYYNVIVL